MVEVTKWRGLCDECGKKDILFYYPDDTLCLCTRCWLERLNKKINDLEEKLETNYYCFKKED